MVDLNYSILFNLESWYLKRMKSKLAFKCIMQFPIGLAVISIFLLFSETYEQVRFVLTFILPVVFSILIIGIIIEYKERKKTNDE